GCNLAGTPWGTGRSCHELASSRTLADLLLALGDGAGLEAKSRCPIVLGPESLARGTLENACRTHAATHSSPAVSFSPINAHHRARGFPVMWRIHFRESPASDARIGTKLGDQIIFPRQAPCERRREGLQRKVVQAKKLR